MWGEKGKGKHSLVYLCVLFKRRTLAEKNVKHKTRAKIVSTAKLSVP